MCTFSHSQTSGPLHCKLSTWQLEVCAKSQACWRHANAKLIAEAVGLPISSLPHTKVLGVSVSLPVAAPLPASRGATASPGGLSCTDLRSKEGGEIVNCSRNFRWLQLRYQMINHVQGAVQICSSTGTPNKFTKCQKEASRPLSCNSHICLPPPKQAHLPLSLDFAKSTSYCDTSRSRRRA